MMWTTMLLCMQSYQIATGKTTNEQMNSHRLEYMIHPEDVGLPAWQRRDWNPFNFGVLQNCGDFWRGKASHGIVWKSQYRGMKILYFCY